MYQVLEEIRTIVSVLNSRISVQGGLSPGEPTSAPSAGPASAYDSPTPANHGQPAPTTPQPTELPAYTSDAELPSHRARPLQPNQGGYSELKHEWAEWNVRQSRMLQALQTENHALQQELASIRLEGRNLISLAATKLESARQELSAAMTEVREVGQRAAHSKCQFCTQTEGRLKESISAVLLVFFIILRAMISAANAARCGKLEIEVGRLVEEGRGRLEALWIDHKHLRSQV
ncbi:hypothetical protein CYMTET_28615 [Cymbomonas tetramitiformis]|uniref:Uncharacterized protein n=1 Tax=Cymbomonas tetramitiformis TaxID=36881 RepID=A0AAE0FP31_9CHLO|nr:hypothetical protein CYMTET_28615 [Cymbomonas tetramitiformis]